MVYETDQGGLAEGDTRIVVGLAFMSAVDTASVNAKVAVERVYDLWTDHEPAP